MGLGLLTSARVPERRLVAAKLAALVDRALGERPEPLALRGLPPGSAAGSAAGAAWILLDHDPLGSLGATLYALDRDRRWQGARLIVGPEAADEVAGRLAAFTDPPAVWVERDAVLEEWTSPGLPEAARAASPPTVADVGVLTFEDGPSDHLQSFVETVRRRHPELLPEPAGDAVSFTYLGLEVARLAPGAGGVVFEVGVGEHDQDARRTVVGHRLVTEEARRADLADLEHALAIVRSHRRVDGPPHPLRRLRRSRWLRALVIDDPTRADLPRDTTLEPVADPGSTRSLRADPPAPAVGPGEVVVCSAGIDLDLVPVAAGAWLQAAEPTVWPRLTVVVPPRDDHPFTRTLLARLVPEAGARLVPVPFTESPSPPAERV